MKGKHYRGLQAFALIILTACCVSCSGRSGKVSVSGGEEGSVRSRSTPERLIRMVAPEENSEYRLGEPVKVVVEAESSELIPDSVVISFDGRQCSVLNMVPGEFIIPASMTVTTGRKSVKVTAFREGRARSILTRFIIVYSDTPPGRSGYRVVNTYPHDNKAFTQGLIYSKGFLYEGTGQQTGSTLREVELRTGKILRQLNLKPDLFGEGITLYKDRIYQVTWQSKVGFVYEKETFRQLNRIYYQTEGWGLTTMNDRIVMGDGTNTLYFMEPESFTVASRLEVYDDEKKVDNLNELEYIKGEIWANIWMTDLIARIDPLSGKVIGYIDLKGILNERDKTSDTDVLNGIAYDEEGDRIFVTGKNWPWLFEIRITE